MMFYITASWPMRGFFVPTDHVQVVDYKALTRRGDQVGLDGDDDVDGDVDH